jgi:hypothetical protein
VLLVDKPTRWSSADVVRQLKSALKIDRVCFGAPLEMEATGLLIILLGEGSLHQVHVGPAAVMLHLPLSCISNVSFSVTLLQQHHARPIECRCNCRFRYYSRPSQKKGRPPP